MIKKLSVLFLLGLFACAAYAQDDNVSQLQNEIADLRQLIAQLETTLSQQRVQVVTAQFDAQSQQTFQQFGDRLTAMENKLGLVEERFVNLRNELSGKIDESQKQTSNEISERVLKSITDAAAESKQFTRDMTNPIRINLPNFGLWLMVTAAFMLAAGMRYKKAMRNAENEVKQIAESNKDNKMKLNGYAESKKDG